MPCAGIAPLRGRLGFGGPVRTEFQLVSQHVKTSEIEELGHLKPQLPFGGPLYHTGMKERSGPQRPANRGYTEAAT